MYDKHHRRIETSSIEQFNEPWWAQWITYLRSAIRNIGGDTAAATNLYEWISNNPRFEDVVYREFFIPAVPPPPDKHKPNERLRQFEEKMKEDVDGAIMSQQKKIGYSHHNCPRASLAQLVLCSLGADTKRKC